MAAISKVLSLRPAINEQSLTMDRWTIRARVGLIAIAAGAATCVLTRSLAARVIVPIACGTLGLYFIARQTDRALFTALVKRFNDDYEFFKKDIPAFRLLFTTFTMMNILTKENLLKIWDLAIHHRNISNFSTRTPLAFVIKAQFLKYKQGEPFPFEMLKMALLTKDKNLIQIIEDEKKGITGANFLLYGNNFDEFKPLLDSATLDAICDYYPKETLFQDQVKYRMEQLQYISVATLNVFDGEKRKELFENAIIKSWEINDPKVCDLIEMTPELYYLLINKKRTTLLQYVLENGRITILSSQYLTCWLKVRDRKTAAFLKEHGMDVNRPNLINQFLRMGPDDYNDPSFSQEDHLRCLLECGLKEGIDDALKKYAVDPSKANLIQIIREYQKPE